MIIQIPLKQVNLKQDPEWKIFVILKLQSYRMFERIENIVQIKTLTNEYNV